MQSVAGDGLDGVPEQGLGVAFGEIAQSGALLPGFVQVGGLDAGGVSRDLDDGPAQRLAGTDRGQESQRALPADRGRFDGGAALHQRHQRDHGVVREVDQIDRVARFVQQRPLRQPHRSQAAGKSGQVLGIQAGQQLVPRGADQLVHWRLKRSVIFAVPNSCYPNIFKCREDDIGDLSSSNLFLNRSHASVFWSNQLSAPGR